MKWTSPKAFSLSLFQAVAALLATALYTALSVGKAASLAAQAERVFFSDIKGCTSDSDASDRTETAYRPAHNGNNAKRDCMTLTEHSEQARVPVIT